MISCEKCKATLDASTNFCPYCGTQVQQPIPEQSMQNNPEQSTKKKNTGLIFALTTVALLLVAAVVVSVGLFKSSSVTTTRTYTNEDLQLVTDYYSKDGKLQCSESRGALGDTSTTYTYDENGHLSAGVTRSSLDGVSRHTFSCDADGNILKKETRTMYGTKTITTYTYENGVRTAGKIEKSDRICTYTYDEHGNISTEEQVHDDGYQNSTLFTCDANGRVTTGLYKSSLDLYGTISYTYDAQGNMVEEELVYDFGSSVLSVYTYSDEGHLLTSKTTYGDGDWDAYTHTYDDIGNRITEIYETRDGEKETFSYTYDENGMRLSSRTIKDGDWIEANYSYSDSGDLLSIERNYKDGETSVTTYDDGRISTESWDFGNGAAFLETYDKKGNISTVEGTLEDGEHYTTSYTYDNAGNKLTEEMLFEDGSICIDSFDSQGNKKTSEYILPSGVGCIITYDKDGNEVSREYY